MRARMAPATVRSQWTPHLATNTGSSRKPSSSYTTPSMGTYDVKWKASAA
jgi:hypothetical protein